MVERIKVNINKFKNQTEELRKDVLKYQNLATFMLPLVEKLDLKLEEVRKSHQESVAQIDQQRLINDFMFILEELNVKVKYLVSGDEIHFINIANKSV